MILDEMLRGFVLWEKAKAHDANSVKETMNLCVDVITNVVERVEIASRVFFSDDAKPKKVALPDLVLKSAESKLNSCYDVLQRCHWRLQSHAKSLMYAEKRRSFESRSPSVAEPRNSFMTKHEAECNSPEDLLKRAEKMADATLYFHVADGWLSAWFIIDGNVVSAEEKNLFEKSCVFAEKKTFLDYLKEQNLGHLASSPSTDSTASPSYVNESVLKKHQLSTASFSSEIPRSKPPLFASPSIVHFLHRLLIAPFYYHLDGLTRRFSSMDATSESSSTKPTLLIVADEALSIVPFATLRSSPEEAFIFEKFDLKITPSLTVSIGSGKTSRIPSLPVVAVGNPSLTENERDLLDAKDLPLAANEAKFVAGLFGRQPLLGTFVTSLR